MAIAIATAAGIIGSAVVTFLGAYWVFVLQRKRLEIGYEVLSANVLIPGPPEATPDIMIVVKNTLIDPSTPAPDGFSPVEEVLGFRVLLRNSGNEPIVSMNSTIDLGEPAATLSCSIERQPDLGDSTVEIQAQYEKPHITRVTIPFLNPGQELVLSLQSIRNDGKHCALSGGAPGVTFYDMNKRGRRGTLVRLLVFGLLFVSAITAFVTLKLLYADHDTKPGWVDTSTLAALIIFLASFLTFPIVVAAEERWGGLKFDSGHD